MFVCVRRRERGRDRQTDRQRDKEGEGEYNYEGGTDTVCVREREVHDSSYLTWTTVALM